MVTTKNKTNPHKQAGRKKEVGVGGGEGWVGGNKKKKKKGSAGGAAAPFLTAQPYFVRSQCIPPIPSQRPSFFASSSTSTLSLSILVPVPVAGRRPLLVLRIVCPSIFAITHIFTIVHYKVSFVGFVYLFFYVWLVLCLRRDRWMWGSARGKHGAPQTWRAPRFGRRRAAAGAQRLAPFPSPPLQQHGAEKKKKESKKKINKGAHPN